MIAAQNGDIDITRLLLSNSTAGIDEQHPAVGYVALHYAAFGGYTEVVQVLLCAGAQLDVQSIQLKTPLIAACQEGYADIVKILIEKGANMMLTDGQGYHPIHIAASKDRAEVMKVLLDQGCNPNTVRFFI